MKTLSYVSMCCLFAACAPDDQQGEIMPYPDDNELIETIEKKSPDGSLSYYILPNSDAVDEFPFTDEKNTINQSKIELGKMLFFETGLAQIPFHSEVAEMTESYSCATCHLPEFGFTPGRVQGIADGAIGYGPQRDVYSQHYLESEVDVQGVRPLSLINVGFVTNTMWNGMFGSNGLNEGTEDIWDANPFKEGTIINTENLEGLEAQNIEGLKLHRMEINERVLLEFGYKPLFDEVFGEGYIEEHPEEAFSFAVSAYLRSIYANEAPFQKWLKGESEALTNVQKLGAKLFFDKARCQNCHNQASLGGHSFHRMGTQDMLFANPNSIATSLSDSRNLGRGGFTLQPQDNYKFKVPQLYNTVDYASYFHGSSKSSLEEVLEFKIAAVTENEKVQQSTLSGFFSPLTGQLSDMEKEALLDFLKNALRDPSLDRYIPDAILSGKCYPNGDFLSINQNKCE